MKPDNLLHPPLDDLPRRALAAAAALLLAACTVQPLGTGLMDANTPTPAPRSTAEARPAGAAPSAAPGAPAASSVPGLMDLLDRPAERALLAGMRAYEEAQYRESEAQLKKALEGNLRSVRDRVAAHKQLAFIYCTSARPVLCEAEFRAALKDDPSFALSRGEAGHPMWGPVYRRVRP